MRVLTLRSIGRHYRWQLPALAMSLAGCGTLPPPPKVIAPPLPSAYTASALQKGDDLAGSDLTRWWERANDPVLNSLVAELATGSLDLQVAASRLEQAQAALGMAQAKQLPAGNVSADAARSQESVAVSPGSLLQGLPGGYSRTQSRYGLQAAASWEIDLFGTNALREQSNEASRDAVAWSAQALRASLIAQLASIYVQLRSTQAEILVSEEQLKLQSQATGLVALLAERGIVAQEELARTRADLAASKASQLSLYGAQSSLLNAIDLLLGQAPGTHHARLLTPQLAVTSLPELGRSLASGSPTDLLSKRPDVLAAQKRAEAFSVAVAQAGRAYYPSFSLTALVGSVAGAPAGLLSSDSASAQGLLGLRWRLFDFVRIESEIKASRGQYREALAQFRLVALRAAQEVEDALTHLNASNQQLALRLEAQLEVARVNDASQAAYKKGSLSERDLISTKRALLDSNRAVLLAQADQRQRIIQAYRALGGGWSNADFQTTVTLSTSKRTIQP